MVLSRNQARRFYDRIGKMLDTQAFYEDAALEDLIRHAEFDKSHSVYELGCGTGRFAERLLKDILPPTASYVGVDISRTMVSLAEQRLKPYGKRARVTKSDGSLDFGLEEHTLDRVVSTYVLDLLSDHDIRNLADESLRVLKPEGKLCLVSLTKGNTIGSKLITKLWEMFFAAHPVLVGGCRPVVLHSYLDQESWSLDYNHIVVQYGIASEIMIASPKRS